MNKMNLFFLTHERYAWDLSGVHGIMSDGHWHNKGTPCIYAHESKAMCLVESHAYHTPFDIPEKLKISIVEAPDNSILDVPLKDLPPSWWNKQSSKVIRKFGDALLREAGTLLIRLPSIVMEGESTIIINPRHWLITDAKITKVVDSRYQHRS